MVSKRPNLIISRVSASSATLQLIIRTFTGRFITVSWRKRWKDSILWSFYTLIFAFRVVQVSDGDQKTHGITSGDINWFSGNV